MKQSIVDKAHRVKESVQDEFDKMRPRNSEEQAWTQGRVVANTPEVQQRPSYQGSSRRIVTEPLDQPESTVTPLVTAINQLLTCFMVYIYTHIHYIHIHTHHIQIHVYISIYMYAYVPPASKLLVLS